MRKVLYLLGICISLGLLGCGAFMKGYSITTEKGAVYDKKVERILVVAHVDSSLIRSFAHSLEHSMISALQSNGVDAVFQLNRGNAVVTTVTLPEQESVTDGGKGPERFVPDAVLHIATRPIYRARRDGFQAIVGIDFEARAMDTAQETRLWYAAGKVD